VEHERRLVAAQDAMVASVGAAPPSTAGAGVPVVLSVVADDEPATPSPEAEESDASLAAAAAAYAVLVGLAVMLVLAAMAFALSAAF